MPHFKHDVNIEEIVTSLIFQTKEDAQVSERDPLEADEFLCQELPAVNRHVDEKTLLDAANLFSKRAMDLEDVSRIDALAVQRDLGFIAGSIIRHQFTLPDNLKKALLLFSKIIDEVPRDTVFSYGPRNPKGARQRQFTELQPENIFISSFVSGMQKNLDCLVHIIRALSFDIGTSEFKDNITKAANSFSSMVDAMIAVRKEVTPQIFTFELRPYFEPITLNGKKYFAPGGAQMPVILIDMLLWGKSSSNHYYQDYFSENISYSPIYYRELPKRIASLPCMQEKIEIFKQYAPNTAEKESLEILTGLLTNIVRFRHVHLAVARSNFALRESSDVGSGGYAVSILEHLLEEATNMRNFIKNLTMKGFFNMKNDFSPYPVGSIFNNVLVSGEVTLSHKSLKIEYPGRLNAMAIDPSGITSNKNMVYTPGEVVLSINLPRYVTVTVTSVKGDITVSGNNVRYSLVKHAVLIMQKALGVDDGLIIDVDNPYEIRHAGLGSSSGTISAVCAAINEMYGRPIKNEDLIRFTAQNHGEEIDDQNDMLMPVQCIGGAAAAGMCEGGILIVAGESSVISSVVCNQSIIIGIPSDYIPPDAKIMMQKEIENLDKFLDTGRKHKHEIAYTMFHSVLPEMSRGSINTLGDLVFDYRFNMGSIKNCSFVYPRMIDIAENLRELKEKGLVTLLALSSVGPAFFAVTNHVKECREAFEKNGLNCTETCFYNTTYQILERI